jgi:hypothetical protein
MMEGLKMEEWLIMEEKIEGWRLVQNKPLICYVARYIFDKRVPVPAIIKINHKL